MGATCQNKAQKTSPVHCPSKDRGMPVAADGPRLPLTDNHRTDINQMTHNTTVPAPEKSPRNNKTLKIVSSSATNGRPMWQQPTSRTHPTDRLVDADAVVIDFGPIRTDTQGDFRHPTGQKSNGCHSAFSSRRNVSFLSTTTTSAAATPSR